MDGHQTASGQNCSGEVGAPPGDPIFTFSFNKNNAPPCMPSAFPYSADNGEGQQWANDTATAAIQKKLDINKMVQYADTHAKSRSSERCAYACRMAFQAGGMNTVGHPVDAGDYGPFLIRHGASIVSPKGYKPLKGDVVVFGKSRYHKYGHIEMYNGKGWVSDFKQHSMVPFFSHVPPYTIYRFPYD